MKNFIAIARVYFDEMEGRHLYPEKGSLLFWWWIASAVLWIASLVYIFVYAFGVQHQFKQIHPYAIVFICELHWLYVLNKVGQRKDQQLINTTNRAHNIQLTSKIECQRYWLQATTGKTASEFLGMAKEIDDLLLLKKKFQKRSDSLSSELSKYVYDQDSKARLLTLMIAIVSVIVALSARSDITINALFDAISDPNFYALLLILAFISIALFVIIIGLRISIYAMADIIIPWWSRATNTSAFPEWTLSYLVRDLIEFHNHEHTSRNSNNAP